MTPKAIPDRRSSVIPHRAHALRMASRLHRRAGAAVTLFVVVLPAGLSAQGTSPKDPIFRPPDDVVQRVVRAQFVACSIAQGASGSELDGLDLALQRLIDGQQNRVARLTRDSLPVLTAKQEHSDAVRRLKPLEKQFDDLIVRQNEIDAAQAPFEARIAAARQGGAPAGTTRLEELNQLIKGLDEEHQRKKDEYDKIPDKDNWLQGRDEILQAEMRQNREKRAPLEAERAQILALVRGEQENRTYADLVAEEGPLETRIKTLREQIRDLTDKRDSAKRTLDYSSSPAAIDSLEMHHEISGFVEQYLRTARDCVQERRQQIASQTGAPGAPGVATPPPRAASGLATTVLNGRWRGNCSGLPPTVTATADSGDMNFYFGEMAGDVIPVRVSFLITGDVIGLEGYGATGQILNDGSIAEGRGGASFYNITWDGKIAPDFARSTPGSLVPDKWTANGNVTVTDLYTTGGGTCSGTWSAATP